MIRDDQMRRAVLLVALLNLAYFGVELAVARRIGAVSLLADSVDFPEDAAFNFIVLAALCCSSMHRARVGMVLAATLARTPQSSIKTYSDKHMRKLSTKRCC
jgi:Co/Zn/Cd efflux system component